MVPPESLRNIFKVSKPKTNDHNNKKREHMLTKDQPSYYEDQLSQDSSAWDSPVKKQIRIQWIQWYSLDSALLTNSPVTSMLQVRGSCFEFNARSILSWHATWTISYLLIHFCSWQQQKYSYHSDQSLSSNEFPHFILPQEARVRNGYYWGLRRVFIAD